MTRLWPEGLPITVTGDAQDVPLSFHWQARRHPIQTIIRHWRVDIEWWQETRVWRDYFTLTTKTGLMVTLFRDLLTGSWYLQQLFD